MKKSLGVALAIAACAMAMPVHAIITSRPVIVSRPMVVSRPIVTPRPAPVVRPAPRPTYRAPAVTAAPHVSPVWWYMIAAQMGTHTQAKESTFIRECRARSRDRRSAACKRALGEG